jgi:hypothetical protein
MANTALLLRSQELWKPASALALSSEQSKFLGLEIPGLKKLFPQGLVRGVIAEIHGRRSSGRTSVCLHMLAQTTTQDEVCAFIDIHDSFHPASAQAAGVKLENLIWVRCHGNAEHAIRAADLLLHAGGFGMVVLDLCETSARVLNRIPLSYWYRFRKAIEHTPAVLLVCTDLPQAKSCSSINLELQSKLFHWSGRAPFLLLQGLHTVALLRKRSAPQTQSLSIPSVA